MSKRVSRKIKNKKSSPRRKSLNSLKSLKMSKRVSRKIKNKKSSPRRKSLKMSKRVSRTKKVPKFGFNKKDITNLDTIIKNIKCDQIKIIEKEDNKILELCNKNVEILNKFKNIVENIVNKKIEYTPTLEKTLNKLLSDYNKNLDIIKNQLDESNLYTKVIEGTSISPTNESYFKFDPLAIAGIVVGAGLLGVGGRYYYKKNTGFFALKGKSGVRNKKKN